MDLTQKEEEKGSSGSLLHSTQCAILPHCALKTLSKNSESCLELVFLIFYFKRDQTLGQACRITKFAKYI